MEKFGVWGKEPTDPWVRDRVHQFIHYRRDAMLRLTRAISDRDKATYRMRVRQYNEALANLEVIMRRQGRVAGALLRTKRLLPVLKHFTVGFELETHRTQTLDRSNIDAATAEANNNRPIDEGKFANYIKRALRHERERTDNLRRKLQAVPVKEAVLRALFLNWVETTAPDDVRETALAMLASGTWRSFVPPMTEDQLRHFCDQKRLSFNSLVTSGCMTKPELKVMVAEWEAKLRSQPAPSDTRVGRQFHNQELVEERIPKFNRELLEVGTDGSVRGFEIRTKNALSVQQFIRAAGIVFATDVEHLIDEGCSFHLHVGVKGAKLSYSADFQAALMEYLFDNIDKVPETVLSRWDTLAGDGATGRYFRPHISTEKYSFVHYHERCGTWEFRCFGNVRTKKDALRCLRLALHAMLYAYRVTRSGQSPLIHHRDFGTHGREIIKCVTQRKPLSKVLPQERRA